ncbi:hypothetical protein F2Q69_00036904 [Brassica cretica]|uniref:Uncharacterized protein n=1 Tax=Brassica cretica TaxID=69181 RepID=A0A8S9SG01_BRACR|nr:hypothetical protein F2Q69_00036904 [Brassica cretica]
MGDRSKKVGIVDSEYIFHQGIQTLGGSGYPEKKNSARSGVTRVSAVSASKFSFLRLYGGSQHGSFELLKNDGTERLRKTRTGSTGLHRPGIVSAITGDLSGVV